VTLFLLSFLVFTASVAALALGVMVRKRPIRAGCGKFRGPEDRDGACDACDGAEQSP
jgi:hypothetical protein